MPLSDDEPICPKFQPNIFDPSRCHDCLRQRHLHAGTGEGAEVALEQKSTAEPEVTSASSPSGKGLVLTPIQSQAEEGDTSCKEDSDGLSVVSSYCDVNGGGSCYEESRLCILSPDCELYICDGDVDTSTDSCRDYQEFNTEDDYLPIPWRSNKLDMTRLDPPPHRPNTRAWMNDARSQDGFGRRSGLKEDRDRRESGYFSLGRTAGARTLSGSSPPAPFRHFEKGHPVFSNRNIEPKDTIPFRNPNLGVASHRQIPETFDDGLSVEIPPPDPYEVAVEVEAQVGPRSPSPTPFKQAESLASSGRKVLGNSFNRGSPSSHVSSHQQSGQFTFSRPGSALQSRSSSPSRGSLPFRRTESSVSLNRRDFDNRGWSQGTNGGYNGALQSAVARRGESGTLPRNFKSFAGSVKTQSNTVSEFRGALHKTELNRSSNERNNIRTSSPPRRDGSSFSQMSLRRSEVKTSTACGSNTRTYSPPRRTSNNLKDSRSPSQTRKTSASLTHSLLHKSESLLSLNERGHYGRCGSPIREGYDIESQVLMRCQSNSNGLNDQEHEVHKTSSCWQGYKSSNRSVVRKTETKTCGSPRGLESRSSSPGRRRSETPSQHHLRKSDSGGSLRDRCKTSSPSRKTSQSPQSGLRTSVQCFSVRGQDSNSSLTLKKNQDPLQKSEASNFSNCKNRSLRESSLSPSRRGMTDSPRHSGLRRSPDRDSYHSSQRKTSESNMKSNSCQSWQESTNSLRSSSKSRAATTSRKFTSDRTALVTLEASRGPESLKSKNGRTGHADRFSSQEDKNFSHCRQSSPPSPQCTQRYTSSQSSMESSESGQLSVTITGRSREEYVMMADLPKAKRVHQRDDVRHAARLQNQQTSRRQELFKPASHSLSKHPSREWEDAGDTEREWHYGGSGYISRAHSSTSLQRSGSPTADEAHSWKGNEHGTVQMQPDLLNFKKGWMSKLDESGDWKKHWFVLTDAGLKYYRDSTAEEKDDLDGEIDLKFCLKVSEFNVEKNYGFQIQTREAVFTLSAMTAGIRRNWIEVLKKCVRPSSSPDLTQLPDSSSDKENSHNRFQQPSRQPSSRHGDTPSETPSSAPPYQRRFDYVELSPVPATSSIFPSGQREAGEGQGRENNQWQEERSQWEAVLSRAGKSGSGGGSNRLHLEDEIEQKWTELERMPLKEMGSLPSAGRRASGLSANEALQREVASLRQQLEHLRQGGGGGGGVGGGKDGVGVNCGPEAPCSRSLVAMERAHRQVLEELQRQHERQMKDLEAQKDRLLLEETQDTARVMEALNKKHKEELERELDKVKRLNSGVMDSQTLRAQQMAETRALQRELTGLSERYSQKCVELNRAEKINAEREREMSCKERDMEQLRKENQDLKARLKQEITRLQTSITEDRGRTSCELEILLRMKDNEIEYLHKEISCLRNELQFLNTENRLACERYTEVHEELNGMKGRSEREIQSLKEHLRLAMAALQEGQRLGNSLDH